MKKKNMIKWGVGVVILILGIKVLQKKNEPTVSDAVRSPILDSNEVVQSSVVNSMASGDNDDVEEVNVVSQAEMDILTAPLDAERETIIGNLSSLLGGNGNWGNTSPI